MRAFVQRGAVAFSADEAVHELYRLPEVRQAVLDRWGPRVLEAGSAGSVDRRAIADIVFDDHQELAWLEELLHPLVAREWLRFVEAQAQQPDPPWFVVAEVPLLYEAGLEARYDAVVAITAPLEVRLERAGERAAGNSHGATRAQRQMPEAEKAARADFHYVNDGSPEELERFVDEVLETLARRHGGSRS